MSDSIEERSLYYNSETDRNAINKLTAPISSLTSHHDNKIESKEIWAKPPRRRSILDAPDPSLAACELQEAHAD